MRVSCLQNSNQSTSMLFFCQMTTCPAVLIVHIQSILCNVMDICFGQSRLLTSPVELSELFGRGKQLWRLYQTWYRAQPSSCNSPSGKTAINSWLGYAGALVIHPLVASVQDKTCNCQEFGSRSLRPWRTWWDGRIGQNQNKILANLKCSWAKNTGI